MPSISVDVEEAANAAGKEYLIWLRVPAAGGDGILLGVCESRLAAESIASALRNLLTTSPHGN